MNVQDGFRNVVIAANQFNPSIISQLWLVKNEILSEDDFEEGCIFIPMLVQVLSREFNLLVTPQQLQFGPKKEIDSEGELIKLKLGKIIEKLPHTPFSAVGLNFRWQIKSDVEGIGQLTRHIFFRDIPLFKEFDALDARFGGYLSKNVFNSRLKLDIKPIINKSEDSEEWLQFSFNYNRDLLKEDKLSDIFDMLTRWDEAKHLAYNILNTVVLGSPT